MADPIRTLMDDESARLDTEQQQAEGRIAQLQAEIAEHKARLATIAAKREYAHELATKLKSQAKAIARRAANP